jgi:hypothetical protein
VTRAPHPNLRRLFTLGGTVARAAQRLGDLSPALPRLASTELQPALLGDDAVRALISAPDLAALFAQVLPAESVEPMPRTTAQAEDAASAAGTGADARAGAEAPARRRKRAAGEALAGGIAADKARRGPAQPAAQHPGSADAADSRAARPAVAEVSASQRRRAARAAEGDSDRPRRIGGITSAHDRGATARAQRVIASVADSISAAGAPATHTDESSALIERTMATNTMRRRAARAGAPSGADTPLSARSAPEQVSALLAGVATQQEDERSGARALTPHSLIHGEAKRDVGAPNPLPVLVRLLERIPMDAYAGGRATRAASARSAGDALSPVQQRDAGSEFTGVPSTGNMTGLRRLLALHDVSPQHAPQPAAQRVPNRTPESGVVAARLRDAELAESLDRLLRREARRDGIDVEGLSG